MKRRTLAWLFPMLLLSLTACQSVFRLAPQHGEHQAPPPPQTPEDALRHGITLFGREALPLGFQILKMYPVPNADTTQVAFYRFLRLSGDTPPRVTPMIGIEFIQRQPNQWSAQGGQVIARTAPAAALVDYIHSTHHIGPTTIETVFGFVVSPDVQAVEATFDTGQVMREPVVHESFVIVASGTRGIRELRVLDQHGQVLRHIAAPPPMEVGGS